MMTMTSTPIHQIFLTALSRRWTCSIYVQPSADFLAHCKCYVSLSRIWRSAYLGLSPRMFCGVFVLQLFDVWFIEQVILIRTERKKNFKNKILIISILITSNSRVFSSLSLKQIYKNINQASKASEDKEKSQARTPENNRNTPLLATPRSKKAKILRIEYKRIRSRLININRVVFRYSNWKPWYFSNLACNNKTLKKVVILPFQRDFYGQTSKTWKYDSFKETVNHRDYAGAHAVLFRIISGAAAGTVRALRNRNLLAEYLWSLQRKACHKCLNVGYFNDC